MDNARIDFKSDHLDVIINDIHHCVKYTEANSTRGLVIRDLLLDLDVLSTSIKQLTPLRITKRVNNNHPTTFSIYNTSFTNYTSGTISSFNPILSNDLIKVIDDVIYICSVISSIKSLNITKIKILMSRLIISSTSLSYNEALKLIHSGYSLGDLICKLSETYRLNIRFEKFFGSMSEHETRFFYNDMVNPTPSHIDACNLISRGIITDFSWYQLYMKNVNKSPHLLDEPISNPRLIPRTGFKLDHIDMYSYELLKESFTHLYGSTSKVRDAWFMQYQGWSVDLGNIHLTFPDIVKYISDGNDIYTRLLNNAHGIMVKPISDNMTLNKRYKLSQFNHNQEISYNKIKRIDELNDPKYSVPLVNTATVPDAIQPYKLKIKRELALAGIECSNCIGGRIESKHMFFRSDFICAEVDHISLKVTECRDFKNTVTDASKEFSKLITNAFSGCSYNADLDAYMPMMDITPTIVDDSATDLLMFNNHDIYIANNDVNYIQNYDPVIIGMLNSSTSITSTNPGINNYIITPRVKVSKLINIWLDGSISKYYINKKNAHVSIAAQGQSIYTQLTNLQ